MSGPLGSRSLAESPRLAGGPFVSTDNTLGLERGATRARNQTRARGADVASPRKAANLSLAKRYNATVAIVKLLVVLERLVLLLLWLAALFTIVAAGLISWLLL